MVPAQIPVFLSQQPSTNNGSTRAELQTYSQRGYTVGATQVAILLQIAGLVITQWNALTCAWRTLANTARLTPNKNRSLIIPYFIFQTNTKQYM